MSEAIGRRHGISRARLEPLRMLVEHGVDDVDERLVAVEEPMAAGEEVPLEPPLALVLGEHLHDPAVVGEVVVAVAQLGLPRPVGDLEHVLKAVGRGLVRPEEPERLAGSPRWRRAGTRRAPSSPRRRSVPGDGTSTPYDRKSGSSRSARSSPPLACGLALIRRSPARREAVTAVGPGAPARRRAPRVGSCASTPRAARGARGSSRTSASGT